MKNYKQKNKTSLLTILLITSLVATSFIIPTPIHVEAFGATIYVPDDHPTIQDAINNATSGDIIIVRDDNIYEESIIIDKQLTIQGEDKETTVIDAMGDPDAVEINADNVHFSGLTVTNSSYDGIDVNANNLTIDNCIIYGCGDDGIDMNSNNSTIKNCTISDLEDIAIRIMNSPNIKIIGCKIFNNYRGFHIQNALNFNITNCEICNNTSHNYIDDSDNAIFRNCTLYNHTNNAIRLDHCDNLHVLDSQFFLNDDSGMQIWGCEGFLIQDCEFYDNNFGVEDLFSYGSVIVDCNFYNNYIGITLYCSNLISVRNCTIYNNNHGLSLSSSDIITICDSYFYDNIDYGIGVWECLKIYLTGSVIMNNTNEGLEVDYSQFIAVNCNFSDNQKGIDSGNSVFSTYYCNFEDNSNYGVYANSNSNADASNCWWGNATGPWHPTDNPTGTGNRVSDYVEFMPWQTELYQPDSLISNLRCQLRHLDWVVVYPDQETPKPLGCAAASVSDWLASAFVTTKLTNYTEGLDTNSSFVNQTTGEAIAEPGFGVLTFGGPAVNSPLYYLEANKIAPVIYDGVPGARGPGEPWSQWYLANGTAISGAAIGTSEDNDLFLMEFFMDPGGRHVLLAYGIGWRGTYAAGKYFDTTVMPHLATFMNTWIIVQWEDDNGDGFVNDPGEGDIYTVLATGN